MRSVAFLLNLPLTVIGILFGLVSIPRSVHLNFKPIALVIRIKSFWWYSWLPKMKRVRAMAIGNVVLLGKILENDLEHELIHVEQTMREPLIHPLLYTLETLRKGYRNNKYEVEAYGKARNPYISSED